MKLSNKAEKVLADSRLTAIDLNSEYISSLHFLIALLKSDNLPRKVFDSKNWNFEELSESLKSEKETENEIERYFLTKEFEYTLKNVKFYSKMYFDKETKPEYILLFMLADKKSYAGRYLREIGMDYLIFKNESKKYREMRTSKTLEFIGSNRFLTSIGLPKNLNNLLNKT
ncbi:Clp protease N-terminal domain-containing protein [uncultured Tenacibaculum sp.]|uniref:Clp protease N-terminal domain-containing protein n=1 Tax=uncultured Tenacibaculum sp. TaxID=174713 RepID=UPI0026243D49|nr:Clp protease N-terminal domain-containing protein [uncultured Tenacibaculum sp.]